jgi:ABC-type glycerol-3-phosphate transport system substrate-binding protein
MTRTTSSLRRTLVAVPALAVAAALTLAGCGSSDTDAATAPDPTVEQTVDTAAQPEQASDELQAYVDAERAQLIALGDSLDAIYSDITIEAEPPSGVVFSYTYAEQVDPAVALPALTENAQTLPTLLETSVFPAMAQAGVEQPLSATYTYVNADGTELWSETFTAE